VHLHEFLQINKSAETHLKSINQL